MVERVVWKERSWDGTTWEDYDGWGPITEEVVFGEFPEWWSCDDDDEELGEPPMQVV